MKSAYFVFKLMVSLVLVGAILVWALAVRIANPGFGGGMRWVDGSIQVAAQERPSVEELIGGDV